MQIPSSTGPELFVAEDPCGYRRASADELIAAARAALDARIARQGSIASPEQAKAFAALRLGGLDYEVFAVIFLDAQNRIIDYREMFRGTIDRTAVYPREIVRAALDCNARSVLLMHCHPSGVAEPSMADDALTRQVKSALALVDTKVLDHLVVAGGAVLSFAERGLL